MEILSQALCGQCQATDNLFCLTIAQMLAHLRAAQINRLFVRICWSAKTSFSRAAQSHRKFVKLCWPDKCFRICGQRKSTGFLSGFAGPQKLRFRGQRKATENLLSFAGPTNAFAFAGVPEWSNGMGLGISGCNERKAMK